MKNKKTTLLIITILLIIVFFSGFFLGRKKSIIKEVVKYEKSKPVIGDIQVSSSHLKKEINLTVADLPRYYFIPYTVTERDTVMVLDTARVLTEHLKYREYNNTLFNSNELGKLDITTKIQFNELVGMSYNYTPIQKVITKTVEKKFQPFVSVNYSTIDIGGLGGGFFIGKIGVEYIYSKPFGEYNMINNSFHTVGLKYKW